MRFILGALAVVLPLSVGAAQGAPAKHASHAVVVVPDRIEWAAAPPSLPPGAKVAVLEGDPKAAGPFTMRISLPAGYRIPPHSHPAQERVTVIDGTFQIGMGDKFDESALKTLPEGGYVSMEPGTHHFVRAKEQTTVQINGVGPWKLTYVNPADNPQRATP